MGVIHIQLYLNHTNVIFSDIPKEKRVWINCSLDDGMLRINIRDAMGAERLLLAFFYLWNRNRRTFIQQADVRIDMMESPFSSKKKSECAKKQKL